MAEEKKDGCFIEGSRPENVKVVCCPHCGEDMVVHLNISVAMVEKFLGYGSDAKERWFASLPPNQREIIDTAKRNGLLDAFAYAVKAAPAAPPNNMEKYLLTWLRLATRALIPEWALTEFRNLYPGKFIEFRCANTVGAVIAGEEIQLFLPIHLVKGMTLKTTAVNGNKAMLPADVTGVRQWCRTKMGYVPSDCHVVIDALKKRAIGEFANPIL